MYAGIFSIHFYSCLPAAMRLLWFYASTTSSYLLATLIFRTTIAAAAASTLVLRFFISDVCCCFCCVYLCVCEYQTPSIPFTFVMWVAPTKLSYYNFLLCYDDDLDMLLLTFFCSYCWLLLECFFLYIVVVLLLSLASSKVEFNFFLQLTP